MLNTIFYTVVGTALNVILTAMLAYTLSRKNLLFKKPLTVFVTFTMFFNGGMIPTYLVIRDLGLLDNLSLLALALVLVVGAGIVYYLTWRNYRPVEHLLAELRRRSVILESPEGTGFNEFRLIEKSVADMQHSMKEVQEALRQEIPRI